VNKIRLLVITGLIAAPLASYAGADFMPYTGDQQKWPTASGAFVKTINSYNGPFRSGTGKQYTLPAYFGLPNKPYKVIGAIDVDVQVGRQQP